MGMETLYSCLLENIEMSSAFVCGSYASLIIC